MFLEQNKKSTSIPIKIQVDSLEEKKVVGKWSNEENLRYLAYVNTYRRKFQSKKQRKQLKMFHRLGQFVGQRTPLQARSHHQKMLFRFRTVGGIIQGLKKELGQDCFKRTCKELKQELQKWKSNQAYDTQQKSLPIDIQCQTDLTGIQNMEQLNIVQSCNLAQNPTYFWNQSLGTFVYPYYGYYYPSGNFN